jgi:hypothetical protein
MDASKGWVRRGCLFVPFEFLFQMFRGKQDLPSECNKPTTPVESPEVTINSVELERLRVQHRTAMTGPGMPSTSLGFAEVDFSCTLHKRRVERRGTRPRRLCWTTIIPMASSPLSPEVVTYVVIDNRNREQNESFSDFRINLANASAPFCQITSARLVQLQLSKMTHDDYAIVLIDPLNRSVQCAGMGDAFAVAKLQLHRISQQANHEWGQRLRRNRLPSAAVPDQRAPHPGQAAQRERADACRLCGRRRQRLRYVR